MKRWTVFFALVLVASLLSVPTVTAKDHKSDQSAELQSAVKVARIRDHQKAFQRAADRNDGTRVSGTGGYNASASYVMRQLRNAGYDVEQQFFNFDFFQEVGPSSFDQVSPVATSYVDQADYDVQQYSGSGDTGVVSFVGIDLALGMAPFPEPPSTSTSGCQASDFDSPAPSVVGKIAVLQRGACAFASKAINAEAAGALGVVIFNQGDGPGRQGLFFGTLGSPVSSIPVVSTSFAIGKDLATSSATGRIVTDTISETRRTSNVIAQSKTGDTNNVVMLGAHLDSVAEGPGINDNGSGSAAILEIALQMSKRFKVNQVNHPQGELVNAVRFAWWGAEESGLLGSIDYVVGLTQAELDQIGVYLNFDMIGSPNFVRFVYDGDGSHISPTIPVPAGSAAVEQVFLDHFAAKGLQTEATVIGQRSDHFAFCVSDIPCGGLFTGAEGIKSAAQRAAYGGTAGEPYDPCYHQACDTFANVSLTALDQMSDAAAHAAAWYAFDLGNP